MEDCILRDAAICGEESTVRRLVHDGADANTIIGALILGAASLEEFNVKNSRSSAPGRLAILSFLLRNRLLSLYTLNAPHSLFQGLTPLGMATYLNKLDLVIALLEKGDGLVLLDGVDSQRATPIMYAARDGHMEILQYLIRKGARTDSVDCHQRSVLFHAVSSPLCLRVCELNVRLQRAESLLSHDKKRKLKLTLKYDSSEYNTVTSLYQQNLVGTFSSADFRSPVKRLVAAISSSDLPTVHSLLFPSTVIPNSTSSAPVLVNLPDEKGWAPIHYCVIAPRANVSMLDTLYLAGADLSLYTTDNTMTPLHIIARYCETGNGASFRMYTFILHLVRDLGASLDAVNNNGETCIHVAARSGRCADVLMAFLECDTDGAVRMMRDNKGRTALEVAKQEYRMAFEQDGRSMRPSSSSSSCTIKPSHSASSLASAWSASSSNSSSYTEDELPRFEQFPRPVSREKEDMRTSSMNTAMVEQMLGDLVLVSEQLHLTRAQQSSPLSKTGSPLTRIDDIEELLQHTWRNSSELLERLRKLVGAELEDLHVAQNVHSALEQLITRLEYRLRVEEYEEERNRTPSPRSFCGSAATPSLVTSASSSKHSSFASITSSDRAALLTPTCSPRSSLQGSRTPKLSSKKSESAGGEPELDFACALASGKATCRRKSALSPIFTARESNSTILSEPDSALETGINLVSIPPSRAPEVQEAQSPTQGGHDSWLNPYVRRANSDLFQKHLANLLEIEQTLFGAEDREREKTPSPGCGPGERVCWRAGVDALQEEDDDGNFLEMSDEEDSETESGEEFSEGEDRYGIDQVLDLDTNKAHHSPTFEVSPPSDSNGLSLVFEILDMARREICAVEGAMITARRSVETTQRYISQAECLTGNLFQKMEHAAQATRLALTLNNLCIGDASMRQGKGRRRGSIRMLESMIQARPTTISPTEKLPLSSKSLVFPFPTVADSNREDDDRKRALKALTSKAPSVQATSDVDDDIRALRQLLVRKMPVWLDAAAYDVDKAGLWVGIIQAVVHDIQRSRL